MKKIYTFLILFLVSILLACKATNKEDISEPEINEPPASQEIDKYPWEKDRESLLASNDLVLIYGGGAHRDVTWNKDHFKPYVTYRDESGKEHWLFDGFLFLEIVDGHKKIFATGYNGTPATKVEWKALADYYFASDNAILALNQCVGEAITRLGKPVEKRKIVIGMPEPISSLTNWGQADGKTLNFSNTSDRIAACVWYIDYVREHFDKAGIQNLELAGFYWIAEESNHTRDILSQISEYLNDRMYAFNWIPYWNAPGYNEWKALDFNYAYLQPNYFFNENIPYSRLDDACRAANSYNMDLELEFDMRAFVGNGNRGSRLYDYMNAFRQNGMLEKKRIAYYQDCDALYSFSKATDQQDIKLYHDFNRFVLEHIQKYNGK